MWCVIVLYHNLYNFESHCDFLFSFCLGDTPDDVEGPLLALAVRNYSQ